MNTVAAQSISLETPVAEESMSPTTAVDSGSPKPRLLTPSQRQAMALKFSQKSYPQIAADLKIHVGTVKKWFSRGGALDKAYQDYVEAILRPSIPLERTVTGSISVADRLKEAAPKALENVIDLRDRARNENVRLAASKDILDRAGYMPIQKMIALSAVEEMSVDELDKLVNGLLDGVSAASPKKMASNLTVDASELTDPGVDMDQSADASTSLNEPINEESANIKRHNSNVEPDTTADRARDNVDRANAAGQPR